MSKILLCPVTNYQSVSKTHVNDFSKVQLCRNSWDTLSVGRELLRESREELHRWLQRINSENEGRRGDTGEMGEERTGEERESDRWSEWGRRDQGNLHGKKKKKDVHVLHFIAAQLLVHLGLNMHAANTLLICSTFLDCNSLLQFITDTQALSHMPTHVCASGRTGKSKIARHQNNMWPPSPQSLNTTCRASTVFTRGLFLICWWQEEVHCSSRATCTF